MSRPRKERPDGFVLYEHGMKTLELLPDEAAGKAIKAACAYFLTGQELDEAQSLDYIAYAVLKVDIDGSMDRFQKICERNKNISDNRKKAPQATSDDQSLPVVTSGNQNRNENNREENKRTEMNRVEKKEVNRAEPETVSTPPVITLPLNDGTEYGITETQCSEWSSLYPAVDVMQQLRNMRGWLLSNSDRRKTSRGIKRFVTSWLAKEQDRGHSGQTGYQRQTKQPQAEDRSAEAYDIYKAMGIDLGGLRP